MVSTHEWRICSSNWKSFPASFLFSLNDPAFWRQLKNGQTNAFISYQCFLCRDLPLQLEPINTICFMNTWPIGSMYGILTNIWFICMWNVACKPVPFDTGLPKNLRNRGAMQFLPEANSFTGHLSCRKLVESGESSVEPPRYGFHERYGCLINGCFLVPSIGGA